MPTPCISSNPALRISPCCITLRRAVWSAGAGPHATRPYIHARNRSGPLVSPVGADLASKLMSRPSIHCTLQLATVSWITSSYWVSIVRDHTLLTSTSPSLPSPPHTLVSPKIAYTANMPNRCICIYQASSNVCQYPNSHTPNSYANVEKAMPPLRLMEKYSFDFLTNTMAVLATHFPSMVTMFQACSGLIHPTGAKTNPLRY